MLFFNRFLWLFLLFIRLVHDYVCGNIVDIEWSITTLLGWCCPLLLIILRINWNQNAFSFLSFCCTFRIEYLDVPIFLRSLELSIDIIWVLLVILSISCLILICLLAIVSWWINLFMCNLGIVLLIVKVAIVFVIHRVFRFEYFVRWLQIMINDIILICVLKNMVIFSSWSRLDIPSLLDQLVLHSLSSGCIFLNLTMNFEWVQYLSVLNLPFIKQFFLEIFLVAGICNILFIWMARQFWHIIVLILNVLIQPLILRIFVKVILDVNILYIFRCGVWICNCYNRLRYLSLFLAYAHLFRVHVTYWLWLLFLFLSVLTILLHIFIIILNSYILALRIIHILQLLQFNLYFFLYCFSINIWRTQKQQIGAWFGEQIFWLLTQELLGFRLEVLFVLGLYLLHYFV